MITNSMIKFLKSFETTYLITERDRLKSHNSNDGKNKVCKGNKTVMNKEKINPSKQRAKTDL